MFERGDAEKSGVRIEFCETNDGTPVAPHVARAFERQSSSSGVRSDASDAAGDARLPKAPGDTDLRADDTRRLGSIVTSGGTFTGWSIDTGSGEAGSGEAGSGEAGSGSTTEVSVLEYLCEELEPNFYAYFGMYGPGDGDIASGDFSSGDPEVCDAVRLYSIVALITAVLLVPIVVMLRCYGGKRVLLHFLRISRMLRTPRCSATSAAKPLGNNLASRCQHSAELRVHFAASASPPAAAA